jgi:hypothetical protein
MRNFTKSYLLLLLMLFSGVFVQAQQYNQMVVGANDNGAIFSCLLDGSSPANFSNIPQSLYNGVFNPNDGRIYFGHFYGIFVMEVDGAGFDTLFYYPAGGMLGGIDLDLFTNQIYFTVNPVDSIYRMDMGGNNVTPVYGGSGNANFLGHLRLDAVNEYIYYGEWGLASGVHRIDYSGLNHDTLLAGVDALYLYLDPMNNHIYYSAGLYPKTSRCDMDGSNNMTLDTTIQTGGIAKNPDNNLLYIADIHNMKMVSYDVTNSTKTDLLTKGDILFGTDSLSAPQGPILVFNPFLVGRENGGLPVVSASPNPTSSQVRFDFGGTFQEIQLHIYAADGRLESNHSFAATRFAQVEINGPAGIYFVEAYGDGKRIGGHKIVRY